MTEQSIYSTDFYDRQCAGSQHAATVVAKLVFDLVGPHSVVDIGCGLGGWLAAFQALGAKRVLGIDGDYVDRSRLLIHEDRFIAHDLARKLPINERFDLAISLEVAEHLPVDAAPAFVSDLISLADVILFSAAIPYQGGAGHSNEQWQSYWAGLFAARGYRALDVIRPKIWNKSDLPWWYAQNTLLYVSESGFLHHAKLLSLRDIGSNDPIDMVHPRKYLLDADPEKISVKRAARVLGTALMRKLRQSIRRTTM